MFFDTFIFSKRNKKKLRIKKPLVLRPVHLLDQQRGKHVRVFLIHLSTKSKHVQNRVLLRHGKRINVYCNRPLFSRFFYAR